MTGPISWSLQLKVNDGRQSEVVALMEEMVAATQNEPGTVVYEWFLTSDGITCHIEERYVDSAAALVHIGNFGANFAERFLSCFTPTAFYLYGDPSAEVRSALEPFGAVHLAPIGGFRRQ